MAIRLTKRERSYPAARSRSTISPAVAAYPPLRAPRNVVVRVPDRQKPSTGFGSSSMRWPKRTSVFISDLAGLYRQIPRFETCFLGGSLDLDAGRLISALAIGPIDDDRAETGRSGFGSFRNYQLRAGGHLIGQLARLHGIRSSAVTALPTLIIRRR